MQLKRIHLRAVDYDRIYEVGWVGRLGGKDYSIRRCYIEGLKERFKMNDIDSILYA